MRRLIFITLALIACLVVAGNASADPIIIDLTTAGASGTQTAAIGGTFTVQQISPQSTGTGVIDSFLRIHQTGQERGYNTDATPPPLDDLSGNFTRSLLLSDVPIVTIGGVEYRQFLLDINQNTDSKLSLNQIQIFLASGDLAHTSLTEAATGVSALIGFSGATEVFRMNTTPSLEIQLDYALNSGSGSGDMFLYVLNSAFTGGGTNVILFSQFGHPNGTYASNDGFEEWSVLKGATPQVPEPASLLLLGTGLLGVATRFRRRR